MTRTLEEITKEEQRYFFRDDGDGKTRFEWPSEFNTEINNISREKLNAYTELHDNVWVGNINRCEKEQTWLVKFVGQPIYNFEYTFAVPHCDTTLIALLIMHARIKYTDGKACMERISNIANRIQLLGGINLFWA